MTFLVAVLAFLVGAGLGASAAVWWLNRRPVAEPSLDASPTAAAPVEASAADAAPAAPGGEADPDLKPILDATRGVLSDLEERYRGARAEEPAARPRRRSSKPGGGSA